MTVQPFDCGVWIAAPPAETRNDGSCEIAEQTCSDDSGVSTHNENRAIIEHQSCSVIAQLVLCERYDKRHVEQLLKIMMYIAI